MKLLVQDWFGYGRIDPGALWLLFLSFAACVFQVCFSACLLDLADACMAAIAHMHRHLPSLIQAIFLRFIGWASLLMQVNWGMSAAKPHVICH